MKEILFMTAYFAAKIKKQAEKEGKTNLTIEEISHIIVDTGTNLMQEFVKWNLLKTEEKMQNSSETTPNIEEQLKTASTTQEINDLLDRKLEEKTKKE